MDVGALAEVEVARQNWQPLEMLIEMTKNAQRALEDNEYQKALEIAEGVRATGFQLIVQEGEVRLRNVPQKSENRSGRR